MIGKTWKDYYYKIVASDGHSTLHCDAESRTYKCMFKDTKNEDLDSQFSMYEPETNFFVLFNKGTRGFLHVTANGEIRSDGFTREQADYFTSPKY